MRSSGEILARFHEGDLRPTFFRQPQVDAGGRQVDQLAGVIDRQLIRLKYGLRGIIPDGALMRVSTVGMLEQPSYALQNQFIRDLLAAIAPQDRKFFTGT